MTSSAARSTLRERLRSDTPLVAPGCFDALSALLVQASGFEAVVVSGFGVSASLLGQPDAELYTATEMVTACRHVARRVSIPVLADADNGYGNAINVMRTVVDLEQAGVASITLEDQRSPKRCPLISTSSDLVSVEEACGKLRAALHARRDPAMLIVARTDARDEAQALHRARAYAAAGADAIKIISPVLTRHAFLGELRAAMGGKPVFISSLGWAATQDARSFHGLASVITHPLLPLATAASAMRANLDALRANGPLPVAPLGVPAIEHLLGLEAIQRCEEAFLPSP